MLMLPPSVRIFVCLAPADMRLPRRASPFFGCQDCDPPRAGFLRDTRLTRVDNTTGAGLLRSEVPP